MGKLALIGALAPLVLLATTPARADFRAPIAGAEPAVPSDFVITVRPHRTHPHPGPMPGATPILPSRFVPRDGAPAALPLPASLAAPSPPAHVPGMGFSASPEIWTLPLVDRRLPLAEREADLAVELKDAIQRIEPVYDPLRPQEPDVEDPMIVSAGTAAMDSVFADHWRRATPDPRISTRVRYIAMAWQRPQPLPCRAFAIARTGADGSAAPADLAPLDCRRLLAYERLAYDAGPPPAIAIAAASLPVFAAPMPGARMSSAAFWAARRAQIADITARLHEQWQSRRQAARAP